MRKRTLTPAEAVEILEADNQAVKAQLNSEIVRLRGALRAVRMCRPADWEIGRDALTWHMVDAILSGES